MSPNDERILSNVRNLPREDTQTLVCAPKRCAAVKLNRRADVITVKEAE